MKSLNWNNIRVSLVSLTLMSMLLICPNVAALSASRSTAAEMSNVSTVSATTSNNWSGYVATGRVFNQVEGEFTVPTVTCTVANAETLFWVGFDGYYKVVNQTVEQDGIGAQCGGGRNPTVSYFAWWEMYQTRLNNTLQPISGMTIEPGDTIKADVSYDTSDNDYILQLSEVGVRKGTTLQQPFVKTTTCVGNACSRQTAEWIAERAVLPADNDTPLAKWYSDASLFVDDRAATSSNATLESISHYSYTFIDMISQTTKHPLAAASSLSATGDSFTDTWQAAN